MGRGRRSGEERGRMLLIRLPGFRIGTGAREQRPATKMPGATPGSREVDGARTNSCVKLAAPIDDLNREPICGQVWCREHQAQAVRRNFAHTSSQRRMGAAQFPFHQRPQRSRKTR